MGAKVEAGMYKDRFAFEAEFRLMIANAKQYNPSGTYAHTEAIFLETFFEKREFNGTESSVFFTFSQFGTAFRRLSKLLARMQNLRLTTCPLS